jgi:hypothetical protein
MTVMPRFVLALTLTLTAFTFVLALTSSAWGGTQPPHPALRGFVEGCEGVPQPCWYGIVPGETSLRDTINILTGLGHTPSEEVRQFYTYIFFTPTQTPIRLQFGVTCNTLDCADVPIDYLQLTGWKGLPIGEVVHSFGPPLQISLDGLTEPALVYPASRLDVTPMQDWSSAFRPVITIYLHRRPIAQGNGRPWHGFLPLHRYCLIEPALSGCQSGSP